MRRKSIRTFSKWGIEKYENAFYQYLVLNWNPLNILATFAEKYIAQNCNDANRMPH